MENGRIKGERLYSGQSSFPRRVPASYNPAPTGLHQDGAIQLQRHDRCSTSGSQADDVAFVIAPGKMCVPVLSARIK